MIDLRVTEPAAKHAVESKAGGEKMIAIVEFVRANAVAGLHQDVAYRFRGVWPLSAAA